MDLWTVIGVISSIIGIFAFFRIDAISLSAFLKNSNHIKKLIQNIQNPSFLEFVFKKTFQYCDPSGVRT